MNKRGILMPVRFDSLKDLKNIYCKVNFPQKNFFQNIRVIEGVSLCNGFVKELSAKRINYTFM